MNRIILITINMQLSGNNILKYEFNTINIGSESFVAIAWYHGTEQRLIADVN